MNAELFIIGMLIHLFVDWFLQNEWQAVNKMHWVRVGGNIDSYHAAEFGSKTRRGGIPLPHIAGIVHATLHTIPMLFVFPLWAALTIGFTHWLIDLRFILAWWRKAYRMTTDPTNPAAIHVAFWQDQVAHLLVIGAICLAI